MASLVVTIIGDDRSGLVDVVARSVAAHGANWERSHLAELAGKFAGIILIEADESSIDGLLADLRSIEQQGLLAITAERAEPASSESSGTPVRLELVGQDHPGIVHEISRVLASMKVNIDELETAVAPAPQGGSLFIANASLRLSAGAAVHELQSALEDVADDLMVDLDLVQD